LWIFATVPFITATELEDEDLLLYLEYPDDWTAQKVIYTLSFTPPEEYNEIFSIERVTGMEGYSLEDFATEQIAQLEYEIEDRPRYAISDLLQDGVGGEDALTVYYRFTSTLEDTNYVGYRIFVIHDNNGYVIDFHMEDGQLGEYLGEKVDTIVQSIVFLNESDFRINDASDETSGIEVVEEEGQEPMKLVPRTCFGPDGVAYTCMKFEQ
jgi:hypothetical protein